MWNIMYAFGERIARNYLYIFYIDMTNDLIRRVFEHLIDLTEGFTKRYRVHVQVYYEQCSDAPVAI
jgi:putative endonuclease